MFNVSFPVFARLCGPSDINDIAPVVVTPAVSGPGVHIPTESICGPSDIQTAAGRVRASTVAGSGVRSRSSFLDMCGRPVHRGALVSWGGLRFKVLRIVAGRAYYGESFSNSVACGLVQVVH